jgi:hypothetical protein
MTEMCRYISGAVQSRRGQWVVRSGDQLYVRWAHGHEDGWFQRAMSPSEGRIRGGAWSATSR